MPAIVRDRNRKIRQDALRELLSKQKLVEKVIDIANKLEKGDCENPQALKAAADLNLKLVNKYLPDLKGIEIEGQIDSELIITRKEYKPST